MSYKKNIETEHPQKTPTAAGNSSISTFICHQGSFCSLTIRAIPLKASFHFICSSFLWQDPTNPQEVWFTISLPCFYRAWLCKWNWWRPQPRFTESLDITVDLHHLQCHPAPLVSSHRAPVRDFLMLQLSSIGSQCPPPNVFLLWAQLCHPRAHNPGSLIRIWWLLVGARQLWVGKLTHGMANKLLWEGGDGKREKRKSLLRVTLVKFFTANHTQDWFTAHFALLTHFSYHTFHWPISLSHQGQMKGMIACTPYWDLL